MARAIVFESSRSGYAIDQLMDGWARPMTVGELIELLNDMDEDDYFILSNDNGYTYGSISDGCIWESDEDGDWTKQEW